ncbi:MAG TPA: TlpA disulfide reductase family protein [Alphaproteobacteria bacterium]|nr:TlpA disulfide reductase family protein [Alphaproteobacteria bacterium]
MNGASFAFASLMLALVLSAPAVARPTVGDEAPKLVVKPLEGETFKLSGMHGEVVIVNFWATWCGPCRREMPALDAYYQSHREQGLEIIGISDDKPRDRGEVEKIANTVSYPIALAHDADENGFGHQTALPLTYVIDKGGVIRTIFTDDQSPITTQELDAAVGPLLGK